jgi:ABC-type branched-subunit amino acid transport system ATPase component
MKALEVQQVTKRFGGLVAVNEREPRGEPGGDLLHYRAQRRR